MKIDYHLLTIIEYIHTRNQKQQKQQKQPPYNNRPKLLLLKASSYLSIGHKQIGLTNHPFGQTSLVGNNITTGPLMYMCMERVLNRGAKAKFCQKANFVASRTVTSFTMVMATMTIHVFLTYAYRDQRQ